MKSYSESIFSCIITMFFIKTGTCARADLFKYDDMSHKENIIFNK